MLGKANRILLLVGVSTSRFLHLSVKTPGESLRWSFSTQYHSTALSSGKMLTLPGHERLALPLAGSLSFRPALVGLLLNLALEAFYQLLSLFWTKTTAALLPPLPWVPSVHTSSPSFGYRHCSQLWGLSSGSSSYYLWTSSKLTSVNFGVFIYNLGVLLPTSKVCCRGR